MALILFDKDAVIDYVPAYSGNRESDSPFLVWLKFLSYTKIQYYSRMAAAKVKDKNNTENIVATMHETQKKQFLESVVSVEGVKTEKGKEITTAEELYELAPVELVCEILKASEDMQKLSEGQRKNLPRVSVGV